MSLVGYARVSTNDQDTNLQMDALARAGVAVVFSEKSSSVGARPQLHQAMASMVRGDVLVVWKTDRLARSLKDLLGLLEKLAARGCLFRSLTEPIDTTSPLGEFMLQVLGAVAQLERAMIRQRCIAGQVAAIERGVVFGRPKALTAEQEVEVVRRWNGGKKGVGESKAALARAFGVGYVVITRVTDESRGKKNTGKLPVLRRYMGNGKC